jgi:hypothetical protein
MRESAAARALSRAIITLYIAALALLPWTWFPPFPWLHEHAQWSDVLFAAAAALWTVEQWRLRRIPRLRPAIAAIALYFLFALLSFLLTNPDQAASAWKLLGIAELCALAFITSDIAARPCAGRAIAWAVAATSIVTAAAAVAGLLLFYAGVETRLIGTYGDLEPSRWYARAQAGFFHPNLLASFSIFASAIIARTAAGLPARLRRTALAALWLTVFLTFSRGILAFLLAAAVRSPRINRSRSLVYTLIAVTLAVMATLSVWNLKVNPATPLDIQFDSQPSSRREAATSSLETLVAHPLTGSGPGTQPGSYRGGPFDAHSTPINIAATLGLPALIVFTSLVVILWRTRKRPTDLALWGGLAGLALDALAQDVEEFRHVWIMLGLADAHSLDDRESRPKERQS